LIRIKLIFLCAAGVAVSGRFLHAVRDALRLHGAAPPPQRNWTKSRRGAARAQDKELAMRAGASVYLAKPIEPTLLRSKLNALLGLAARESLQAQLAEQRAVQDELERRLSHVQSTLRHAHEYLQASIERSARTRAFKAFIAERGTPAHFDAWWPNVFQNAWVCKSGEAEAPKRPGATLGP